MNTVAKQLRMIADEVGAMYLERSVAIEAVLLAILCEEHGIFLGKPGTGKSATLRELISRILNARYFETLLSKTRPDQAVLGPYDVPLLRDKGEYKRKIDGFLPTANFAFLDEVGKMSPTLGHELLAVLQERVLHQVNGSRSWIDVPLVSAFGASNEVPVHESEDAAALWDRLFVRVQVDYVQEPGNFLELFHNEKAVPSSRTTIDFEDLLAAIRNDVPAVTIPHEISELVAALKAKLANAGITVSDRRWLKCRKLLKAAAFLDGRDEVNEDDLRVLKHVLWEVPEQIQTVERTVLSVSNPLTQEAMKLMDDVQAIRSGLADRRGESNDKIGRYGIDSAGKLRVIESEAEKLKDKYAGKNTAKVDEVLTQIAALRDELLAATLLS